MNLPIDSFNSLFSVLNSQIFFFILRHPVTIAVQVNESPVSLLFWLLVWGLVVYQGPDKHWNAMTRHMEVEQNMKYWSVLGAYKGS